MSDIDLFFTWMYVNAYYHSFISLYLNRFLAKVIVTLQNLFSKLHFWAFSPIIWFLFCVQLLWGKFVLLLSRHFDKRRNYWYCQEQESWAVAKMTARCALCMGALKIFGSPWLRPRLLFPKFLMGFCSDWAYKCACKIWISQLYPLLR